MVIAWLWCRFSINILFFLCINLDILLWHIHILYATHSCVERRHTITPCHIIVIKLFINFHFPLFDYFNVNIDTIFLVNSRLFLFQDRIHKSFYCLHISALMKILLWFNKWISIQWRPFLSMRRKIFKECLSSLFKLKMMGWSTELWGSVYNFEMSTIVCVS